MSFKKYDGSIWQPITSKKLKGIPYTGTLPATITGTKAGYLHRYKIYGNTEQTGTPTPENPIEPQECGERTGNLFNVSDYSVGTTSFVTKRITLEPNTTYTMSSNCPLYNVGALIVIGNVGESFTTAKNGVYPNHPISRTTDANGDLVIGLRTNGSDYEPADYDTMLNTGSTPLPYEPYGYKLPLTSGSTPVDIYIGDDTLSTDEYVDSGTGKIYRMVDGVLTPIDPPAPFPQIPTSANSTTISWAGSGLAPSQFDSIQEWVDAQTYKRINGAWVADSETIIYGFHVDPSVADPANAVTYLLDAVGKTPATNSSSVVDYSDWADAFFMPKPCMLYYDGTVAYYLNPNDYTKKADGSPSDVANPLFPGNAMMEWPVIWWKFEAGEVEGEMSFYASNRKVDSTYHCWCNIDAENHITDHFYTAIYNGTSAVTYSTSATYAVGDLVTYSSAEYRCTTAVETPEAFDSTKWEQVSDVTRLRSLSGKALTAANGNGNTTSSVEVQRATANNNTATVEWYIDVFSDRQLINGLLTLVSKTLDSSAVYGRGLDSGSQAAKEAYVTGTLNDKGLFWGNPSAGTSAKKCFGMENWDGCAWHRTAGLIGSSSTGGYAYKLTYNTADGSTATSYNSTGSGYLVGATDDGTTIARPANGYVKTMKVASATGIWLPGTSNGGSVTYYCDYYYNGTGYYGLAGGYSSGGAHCGCWCLSLSGASGYPYWAIAASPSCKPLASRYRSG